MCDFEGENSINVENKEAVILIINFLLEIGIALCETVKVILDKYHSDSKEDELKNFILATINPERIFASFKEGS